MSKSLAQHMLYVQAGRANKMATHGTDDDRDLSAAQRQLDAAQRSSNARGIKVDDLTSRFRELRRRNHFRLMLEEIFNE